MADTKYDTLKFLASETAAAILHSMEADQASFEDAVQRHSSRDRLAYLQEAFRTYSLIDAPEDKISIRGRICHYSVEAIEGGNLTDVIDRFHEIDRGSLRIEVVRQGMTTEFVRMIARLAPVKRLMVCSPWINLGKDRLHMLMHGVELAKRMTGFYPEISVVTRPFTDQPGGNETETLAYLKRINSVITYHSSLHSKLYILESGSTSPQRIAFVGSENFTKLRYHEVGLRINNDHQLVDHLIRYFISLSDQET